jgi:hypothetical protein
LQGPDLNWRESCNLEREMWFNWRGGCSSVSSCFGPAQVVLNLLVPCQYSLHPKSMSIPSQSTNVLLRSRDPTLSLPMNDPVFHMSLKTGLPLDLPQFPIFGFLCIPHIGSSSSTHAKDLLQCVLRYSILPHPLHSLHSSILP